MSKAMIEAKLEVIRVQTMSSNAIRITLEMPEYMIPQMGMFAECQRSGIYLHGEFTAVDKKEEEKEREEWLGADNFEIADSDW